MLLSEGPGKDLYRTDRFMLPEGNQTADFRVDVVVEITANRGGKKLVNFPVQVKIRLYLKPEGNSFS